MTPAGYMAKRVQTPAGFHVDGVLDVYSVGNCVNDDFADYIDYWKHNGHWLFDSPEIIQALAQDNHIQLEEASLFYYEVYEKEFNGKDWVRYQPEASLRTDILVPSDKALEGFDVVSSYRGHSPLSCNYMAAEIPTNEHCLFVSFEEAYAKVSAGAFNDAEPGPYRIFAVYSVPWS
jgi:hypothetical protein